MCLSIILLWTVAKFTFEAKGLKWVPIRVKGGIFLWYRAPRASAGLSKHGSPSGHLKYAGPFVSSTLLSAILGPFASGRNQGIVRYFYVDFTLLGALLGQGTTIGDTHAVAPHSDPCLSRFRDGTCTALVHILCTFMIDTTEASHHGVVEKQVWAWSEFGAPSVKCGETGLRACKN